MIDAINQFPNQNFSEWGVESLIKTRKKLGLGAKPTKREKALNEDDWPQKLGDELHKPIKRNFT